VPITFGRAEVGGAADVAEEEGEEGEGVVEAVVSGLDGPLPALLPSTERSSSPHPLRTSNVTTISVASRNIWRA
jgi:hypothetical protein